MTHAIALSLKITQVFLGWREVKAHTLDHFNAFGFEAFKLGWIIGNQTNLMNTKVTQNVSTYRIVTIINSKTEFGVGINCVTALIL